MSLRLVNPISGETMNWNEIAQKVTPYVVKIETPDGHGTGFLCLLNENRTFCGIATAHHVIRHADYWQEPMRIIHHHSSSAAFLQEDERIIFPDSGKDSAVILFPASKLQFPEALIPLRPMDDRLPIGAEVGWLGYPGIIRTLCFFSGNISAARKDSYLI